MPYTVLPHHRLKPPGEHSFRTLAAVIVLVAQHLWSCLVEVANATLQNQETNLGRRRRKVSLPKLGAEKDEASILAKHNKGALLHKTALIGGD